MRIHRLVPKASETFAHQNDCDYHRGTVRGLVGGYFENMQLCGLFALPERRGGNEDSEQIFPLRPSRLECNFGAMTSAAGKNETSHHPSDLLSSKIGCSNEISVLHWKQVLCWSHLGCIRTKFLKSWFHVIDDYRLKYFSSAGLPWSPASNSLTHHECSQLTSTSRIKVSLWLESASFMENLDESSASVKKRCKKYLGQVATISCNVSQRVSRKSCLKDK